MFRRMTSAAASAALTLTTAAVVLTPATAQAAPETYTGHVQVIVGETIVGCVMPGGSWAYHGTDPSLAYQVSIPAGSQQDLTITSGSSAGLALGVNDESATFPMSQSTMGYTFLTATSPVPAGSPSMANRQSAIWSVDPGTMHLSASYVWPDQTVQAVQTWQYNGGSYVGLSPNVAAVAVSFPAITPATFRIGESCSGQAVYDSPQAITFTSAVPTPAYPGQTYTIAATGGASGSAVTFTSATSEVCEVDGDSVSFTKPGTCTIEANQAAAPGYAAAPTVSQQITVSAIPTSLELDLSPSSVVTGQGTTATAQIGSEAGSIHSAGGVIEFRVDGTPVDHVAFDANGRAVSRAIEAGVGTHQVSAIWFPEDNYVYDDAEDAATLTVAAANTTTKLTVKAAELSATVTPVAPGAGTPTGAVTFRVDGAKVGTANLHDGTAKLAHVVAVDKAHAVSAEYAGDADFTASSASTSRTNPTITARVSSTLKARSGWYRTPVKVSFTCATKGAELVTACPKPITIKRQGSSSLTRTIRTADGGIATVTAGVRIDTSKPRVGIKGVKAGRSYFDAPKPKCSVKDAVSGVKNCKITSKRKGSKVTVTAKATDVAGNVRTKRVSYRLAGYTIQGAKQVNGVWRVRRGETYTILVRGAKPRYVYASPNKPHRGSVPFKAAGKNRWALGVTMSMATSYTRSWKLGYVQKGKLHTIRVRVVG